MNDVNIEFYVAFYKAITELFIIIIYRLDEYCVCYCICKNVTLDCTLNE